MQKPRPCVPPAGVEPATLGLLDPRSNRLSYGGSVRERERERERENIDY
uniref:Bm12134 n=1 Tax=Brugia malayi TaxID=6279 RepID=A0A0H5SDS2_BRUMA|nr:Bm12134 [Brugia malayi]